VRITAKALVLLAFAGCRSAPPAPCEAGGAGCVAVTVPRGATLRATVDSLQAHGLVANRFWFTLYARVRGLGSALKSGTYAFHRDAGWGEIVAALRRGRGTLIRFTVPEGLMLDEVGQLAASELAVSRDSFRAATEDPVLLRDLGLTALAASAEGYLYPTTYTVRPHPSARELVGLMSGQFRAHWLPVWQARLDSLRMTRHEVVTLASIIQAEVRYGQDREYVSAVYHNRLRRGMLLQADPTIVYALGRRPGRVYERDLAIRSPYNTYVHPGLPPGPISQPDSAALAAALYPARAPFLYFVAQPDGKHIFSVTYAEHLAAIRRVKELQSGSRTRAQAPS
jgi:UPF0755 protein